MQKKRVLTGDRPTGPLHVGHYVGSLLNRVHLQNECEQFVLIADVQALTDNYENPQKVHDNVLQVMLDYLAVGIDPEKTTCFIQSMIPQIAELTMFYLNLVTIGRLQRNPTVKAEIQHKGFGQSIPAGFFMYPVSQAADITIVKAQLVPVGDDQLPMLEQTNEIVRSFNRIYQCDVFPECTPLISQASRLPGLDGKAKMSKSLGNALFLSDTADQIAKKVRSMYTDPDHIHVADPGKVDGNTVFTYLDIFDPEKRELEELKAHYAKGGLGDMVLKKRLTEILEATLGPIRTRRAQYAQDMAYVKNILLAGTAKTEQVAAQTMQDVKEVMKLIYT